MVTDVLEDSPAEVSREEISQISTWREFGRYLAVLREARSRSLKELVTRTRHSEFRFRLSQSDLRDIEQGKRSSERELHGYLYGCGHLELFDELNGVRRRLSSPRPDPFARRWRLLLAAFSAVFIVVIAAGVTVNRVINQSPLTQPVGRDAARFWTIQDTDAQHDGVYASGYIWRDTRSGRVHLTYEIVDLSTATGTDVGTARIAATYDSHIRYQFVYVTDGVRGEFNFNPQVRSISVATCRSNPPGGHFCSLTPIRIWDV